MKQQSERTVVTEDAPEDAGSLLESLVAEQQPMARIDGVVIGVLVGLDADGVACVDFPGCPVSGGVPARTTAVLEASHQGREVALMFERGEPGRPIVMGLIQHPASQEIMLGGSPVQVEADGQRLQLTAREEIVLRCGQSSIVLTRAGKILIRGKYLLSRSSGANRIKGGSVQLN